MIQIRPAFGNVVSSNLAEAKVMFINKDQFD